MDPKRPTNLLTFFLVSFQCWLISLCNNKYDAFALLLQAGLITIDGWLKLTAPAQTAVLFKELRLTLHAVLKELIRKPEVYETFQLLSYDILFIPCWSHKMQHQKQFFLSFLGLCRTFFFYIVMFMLVWFSRNFAVCILLK